MAMTAATLHEPLTGPGAWTAATVDPPPFWYYRLPPGAWAALDEAVAPRRRGPRAVTELVPSDRLRAACAPALAPVGEALERGRGFAVIERVPLDRYSPAEAQAVYWLVGQLLGAPLA